MSGLRPVDETLASLLAAVRPLGETETRSLDDALGLCLAEDVTSPVNVPPADNSAMDGFAFRHGDIAEGEWFRVSARIPAGEVGGDLEPATLARIFTGAQIPPGADTVIMQENTEQRDGEVRIENMPEPYANVRECGQDIVAGSTVLQAGERLTPACLGLLASVGVAEVKVVRPLRVAIMSTGDELVEPGTAIRPGKIYNSNRYTLSGLLRSLQFEVIDFGIVEDTPEATERALSKAAKSADCILSSGGVSVGEEDHVKDVVEKLGRIDVWKLAIKPGKPLAFGEVKGVPFFGLPGNPVSTFVTFLVIARPCLQAMQGFSDVEYPVQHAVADFVFKAGGRREYLRVRTVRSPEGVTRIEKFPNQGSGIMSSVVWADALAVVEIGQEIQPGDQVRIYPLKLT
jgi:molybdopterin molybdotransferase